MNERCKARDQLPFLLKKQDHRCRFCRCLILTADELRAEFGRNAVRLIRSIGWAGVLIDGKEYWGRLATVEHIIPLSDGGGNDIKNLAAACYRCNQARSRGYPCLLCSDLPSKEARRTLVLNKRLKKLKLMRYKASAALRDTKWLLKMEHPCAHVKVYYQAMFVRSCEAIRKHQGQQLPMMEPG